MQKPYIVDLGAHIGLFALSVLNANSEAEILSVEASSETFKLLKKNARIRNNTQSAPQWEVLNRAGWKEKGVVQFSQTGNTMSHHVLKTPDAAGHAVETVTLQELADLAQKNGKTINLMKIDIEGAEEEFLFAFPDLLQKIERLVIEIHPQSCDEERIMALLRQTYKTVESIEGRASAKPLLYCY